jgi:hypothetical protein
MVNCTGSDQRQHDGATCLAPCKAEHGQASLWVSVPPIMINECLTPGRGTSGSMCAREVPGESSSFLTSRGHTTALDGIGVGDARSCARGVLRRPAQPAGGPRRLPPALPGTGGYLLAGTLWPCALVAQGIEQRFPNRCVMDGRSALTWCSCYFGRQKPVAIIGMCARSSHCPPTVSSSRLLPRSRWPIFFVTPATLLRSALSQGRNSISYSADRWPEAALGGCFARRIVVGRPVARPELQVLPSPTLTGVPDVVVGVGTDG